MLSPQTQRGSALLKSTPVFILGLFLPLKKSKESELTELIKLILLKHDRVFFLFCFIFKMKPSHCVNMSAPCWAFSGWSRRFPAGRGSGRGQPQVLDGPWLASCCGS